MVGVGRYGKQVGLCRAEDRTPRQRSAPRDFSSGRADRVIDAPEVFLQFWREYPFELVEQLLEHRRLTRIGEECFALSFLDNLHSSGSSRFVLGGE